MTSRILERLMGTDCQIPFGSMCTVIYFPGLISFHDYGHLPKLDCSVFNMDTYSRTSEFVPMGFCISKLFFNFVKKSYRPLSTVTRSFWFEPFIIIKDYATS